MPRPKPDPALVAAALELLAAGCSLRDAAETLGVTEGTIRAWKKRGGGSPPAATAPAETVPDHMAPPTPPPEAVEVGHDLVGSVRAMLNRTLTRSAAAEGAGNYTAAQRDSRDAAALVTVLARLSRSEAEDAEVLRISRVEIGELKVSLTERVAAILNRPLLCAHCSRALSVAWGTEGLVAPSDIDPGAAAKAR